LTLAWAPALSFAKESPLLALGMEHFRDTASVADDPARGETLITTERGFAETAGPMGTVWHDEFLTAVIEQKSGRKSFRIDVSLTYSGGRRTYPSANLEAMGGPKSVQPTLVRTTSTRCEVGDCVYTDQVQIPVEEEVLRRLAGSYSAGHAVVSTFRLIPKTGAAYRGKLSNAEAAGLLAKVDGYVPGSVGARATGAPPVPQRLDLGLSGLPVSASADNPSRVGILVVQVNGGSVAEKAGIITGDIIDEVDGRPTHSLVDLETALGASAGHATAAIKIFRGQKEMTLKAHF
jgi:hypothetical protein